MQWYGGLAKWCEGAIGKTSPFQLGFPTTRLVYAGTERARSQPKSSFVYYLESPLSIKIIIPSGLIPHPALRSPVFWPARYQISRATPDDTQNRAMKVLICPYA